MVCGLLTFPPKKGRKKNSQKLSECVSGKKTIPLLVQLLNTCFLIVTEPFVRRAQKRRVRFYQIEGRPS